MTKAVFYSLGFILFFAAASTSPAQTSATDIAVNRAVLNQANTLVLRQKLVDARSAVVRGDLVGAAKLYEDAYYLVEQIGDGIDTEKAETISGLVSTRLELARRAQDQGDLVGADKEVTRALKVDPQNAAAIAFKKKNDQMLAAMKGRIPDTATLEQIPAIVNQHADASTLVQDGKLLYEMGKLEEAQVKLNQALQLDPNNQGAYYYLNLVKQGLYARQDRLHTVNDNERMVQVQHSWEESLPNTGLPTPNPAAWTNLIYTGSGRQAIFSKLDRIRLDSISFDGLPLSEVVRYLTEQSKLRDPEKKGINFLISANAYSSSGATTPITPGGGTTTIDPATGLPVTQNAGAGESVDINSVVVKLNLNDVRLADLLDAIVEVADHPITYSIRDYAVVFSVKGPETPVLYSRHFKVDPNTFYQGLQSVDAESFASVNNSGSGGSGGGSSGGGSSGNSVSGAAIATIDAAPGIGQARQSSGSGGGGSSGGNGGYGGLRFVTLTNATVDISLAAKNFFETLGVNLDPPKSIFFNDRLGELFVYATEQDLDTIENAIEVLNEVSPQIHIKARFIEVEQDDENALGFQWYLGQINLGNVVGSGGSSPSLNVPPSAANPPGTVPGSTTGTFPGNTPVTVIPGSSTDQLITGGLRNVLNAPAVGTLTGILTDPNFRVVLQALSQRTGFETLAAPEVTTISGRQTQMRATRIETVVTGFGFQQGTAATTTTGTQ